MGDWESMDFHVTYFIDRINFNYWAVTEPSQNLSLSHKDSWTQLTQFRSNPHIRLGPNNSINTRYLFLLLSKKQE